MKSIRYTFFCLLALLFFTQSLSAIPVCATAPARQFYELVIYQIKDKAQEERVDQYLKEAWLPVAHRLGLTNIGVFKTQGIDTAKEKKIYVLLTHRSLKAFQDFSEKLYGDKELIAKGKDYLDAGYNNAPYLRKETILMEAFAAMPALKKPEFAVPVADRVYELRNYESASEKLHLNKVLMFNKEEMEIFERIGSRPMFYGQVLAGSHMPNLMYMTAYDDKKSRDEHWAVFVNDANWKRMSALPEYQNNVSNITISFLTATAYSDL